MKRPNRVWITTTDIVQPFTVYTQPSFGPPTYPLRQRRHEYSPLILEKGNLNLKEIGGLPGPPSLLLNELVFKFQPEPTSSVPRH